ncbi:hypothetical protein SLEP1_g28763 [Rubroshorea leprosula]|uniref:Uncharacterized protein n=1 Tax=Rubroshorea leprosula TaxID=152421 RepID=A0AAV5K461_9ROSI|nr:hypothetical protein SLEP1_g28763 [Rubroshorea leprosula]
MFFSCIPKNACFRIQLHTHYHFRAYSCSFILYLLFGIHVDFFPCTPIILLDSLPPTIEIWIQTWSSASLGQSRHLLKCSFVEKALINRGLRRSLTPVIDNC